MLSLSSKKRTYQHNQPTLLRQSTEKGLASLQLLCDKLQSLLDDDHTRTSAPPNDTSPNAASNTAPAASFSNATGSDIYNQFLFNPYTTPSNKMTTFLSQAKIEMGLPIANTSNDQRFRCMYQKVEGAEDCFLDGRYLVWVCEVLFNSTGDDVRSGGVSTGSEGGVSGNEVGGVNMEALKAWQHSIVELFTNSDKLVWKLMLQKIGVSPKSLTDATRSHLRDDFKVYFEWPSFLRNLLLAIEEEGKNKRRKSNDGSHRTNAKEPNAHLPLLGYMATHAFLCSQTKTIHEVMDSLSGLMKQLPIALDLVGHRRQALLSGFVGCLVDKLGEGVVEGLLSLRDEEEQGQLQDQLQQPRERGAGSILGAEVGQIVDLIGGHCLLPDLAKSVNCLRAELVSNIAATLLDYSVIHHRLHHETPPVGATAEADYDEVIEQLLAKDALKVMQFIHKSNPQLRRELSDQKFTKQTYNHTEGDPHMHPIVTFLRARLASGNIHEGATICRSLESCTGIHDETKRYCFYLLFGKMQDDEVLLEHDWNKNRGGFLVVPFMEMNGRISNRKVGNVTLANIQIGHFGRNVALEYLRGIVAEAKAELLSPNFLQSQQDKREFIAIKDAVRRTVLKFLVPRPYSPTEALRIATSISEADQVPLLKYHSRPTKGQSVEDLCCKILQQPSLMRLLEEEAEAAMAAEEENGVLDMSIEILPMTPAKTPPRRVVKTPRTRDVAEMLTFDDDTPQRSTFEEEEPAKIAETPQRSSIAETPQRSPPETQPAASSIAETPEKHEEIVLGDTDDEDGAQQGFDEIEENKGRIAQETKVFTDARNSIDIAEQNIAKGSEEKAEEMDDSMTKSLDSPYARELDREDEEECSYDSNEEYADENENMNYPPHYHQYPGNYSESDDYEMEDIEEDHRRVAFEGQYDAEEGRGIRGNSSSDGSIEVFDIADSSEEEEKSERDEVPHDDIDEQYSSEEEPAEVEELNEVVNDYIGAESEQGAESEEEEEIINDGRILHDAVNEYIPVNSPRQKSPVKENELPVHDDTSGEAFAGEVDLEVTREGEDATEAQGGGKGMAHGEGLVDNTTIDVDQPEDNEDEYPNQAPIVDDAESKLFKAEFKGEELEHDLEEPLAEDDPVVDDMESFEAKHKGTESVEEVAADDKFKAESAEQSLTVQEDHVEADQLEKQMDDEADKSDAPYSSDGGNLGGELESEDMNADDEHESLDTEDDKRSLAEQGETFDEEEAGPSPVRSDSANEDVEDMMDDEPSILVAAAMSSQRHGSSSYPMAMTKSYRRSSIRSVDNDAAAAAVLDTSEENLAESHVQEEVIPEKELIDLVDSDVEVQEGGLLSDGGYLPDAEATEEEKIEKKKTRTIDDGYVPDAEATEEESSKPIAIDRAGTKAVLVKKRDVRFEAVLETREAAPMLPPPLETAHQNIDPGYFADGALTEEEKRERQESRQERRTRSIEEGYYPDGHTTATDDDTAVTKDKQSPRQVPPTKDDPIDPGYLPSEAVEGTEEERSEEESQGRAEASLASVLVATALVTQNAGGVIANKASLSTQSIDEGYVPDGTFDEEERGKTRKREVVHRHDVLEEGYCPDGHTTPGEATEEDQPDDNPQMLLDATLKLSESVSVPAAYEDTVQPPVEPATSQSIDEGYMPSAVEEDRNSEEEDTLTDVKTGATHDTEEESLAVASSADVTEKHSKSDNDTAAAIELKEDVKSVGEEIVLQDAVADTKNSTVDPDNSTSAEPIGNIDKAPESNLLQPIIEGVAHHSESPPSPKIADTRITAAESHTAESDVERRDDESVQTETSSVRRSSRKKTSKVASSPNITTGRRGNKASILPAVPENEKLEEQDIEKEGPKEPEKPEAPSIASRTRRRGKRAADDDDTSHASSLNDESVSVASRTRRRGKQRAGDDDDGSHASKNDDGTSIASRTRRRGKRATDNEDDDVSVSSIVIETSSRASTRSKSAKSEEKTKTAATKTRGRKKAKQSTQEEDVIDEEEVQESKTESVASPPTTRRGRKRESVVDELEDAESVASPPKTRGGKRKKKTTEQETPSTIASPTKRSSRRTRNNTKDDASESIASPPKAVGGKRKKKDTEPETSVSSLPRGGRRKKDKQEETESIPPTPASRSSKRTRKTEPSEGSESIASTRPRRNTRSTKKYGA